MIRGKGGIEAKVVADSIHNGIRLTTMALTYPRFIHAEFMTHRMFSRNASSSRAIPIEKMNQRIAEYPAGPVEWGKNQAGMQARTALPPHDECVAETIWHQATMDAIKHSKELLSLDVHKQIANRLTEPFQFIKVVVTATEWDNFFALRLHPDAQPEIQELARVMKEAMGESEPRNIGGDDDPIPYHMPFISMCDLEYWAIDEVSTEDLIKASVARCARVSYMNHDGTNPDIQKDIELHDRLLEAGHLSPFEHVAKPMRLEFGRNSLSESSGITHQDLMGKYWSGNFKGWIQYRNIL